MRSCIQISFNRRLRACIRQHCAAKTERHLQGLIHVSSQPLDEWKRRAIATQVDLVGRHSLQRPRPCPPPLRLSNLLHRFIKLSAPGELKARLFNRRYFRSHRHKNHTCKLITCISSMMATSTRLLRLVISMVQAVCWAEGSMLLSCPAAGSHPFHEPCALSVCKSSSALYSAPSPSI